MKKLITIILLLLSANVFSQNIDLKKIAGQITEEGKYLYRLEITAWHGTDIFTKSFKEKERIGGYFSYIDNGTAKCLFFSRSANPKVIGVVSFGDIKIVETATIDFKERDFREDEKQLFTIRQKALAEIQGDSVLFKTYSNTSFNLIPYIRNGEKRVYVLTAPKVTGVMLFGNDYLLTFDEQNNVKEKKEIHRNLIPIDFDGRKEAVVSVHSHAPETGDFITPTDICTLMLYAQYAGWDTHIVLSDNYVSIWDCDTESLTLETRADYDKTK